MTWRTKADGLSSLGEAPDVRQRNNNQQPESDAIA